MKLTDLEPRWVSYEPNGGLGKPQTIQEAQGVLFLCPSCFRRHAGPIGTHRLLIPFAGRGAPGLIAWDVKGTTLDDLTLSPSILVHAVPITPDTLPEYRDELCRGWHGWITNGEIRDA